MIVHLGMGMSLLPIIPILLLPFALVFFVVVFPIWGVALGVLGLLLLIVRGIDAIARSMGGSIEGTVSGVRKTFRWVLTFGGLARLASDEIKKS
jgi:hypothetical protein